MAVAKWNAPSAEGANIASTALDSLGSGSRSTGLTHDNSTNLDLRAFVRVNLGSITPGTGGSITLEEYASAGANVDDFPTGTTAGGSPWFSQTKTLVAGTGAKQLIFDVQLAPASVRFVVLNSAGVALAASGNALRVTPYNEAVS